jgi:hypothetical protein
MNTIKITLISSLVILYIGCTPTITKEEFAPKMYTDHPASIIVLPPINQSTAADAKEYYSTTIAEPLTNSGYYVFPVEVVNDILKQEGLYDTETMTNVVPQKFKEYFGADAVLYVTIQKWNTSYLVLSGGVTVKLACELKSTKTGETIWFYDDEVEVNTTGDSGGAGGLAGLLVKAVATAVKTAMQDYIPVAREANEKILTAIPFGKYHKDYNTDGSVKINKKSSQKKDKEEQK